MLEMILDKHMIFVGIGGAGGGQQMRRKCHAEAAGAGGRQYEQEHTPVYAAGAGQV